MPGHIFFTFHNALECFTYLFPAHVCSEASPSTMWRSGDDLQDSVLSFAVQILEMDQAIRFGIKYLYPLNHLISSHVKLLKKDLFIFLFCVYGVFPARTCALQVCLVLEKSGRVHHVP